VQSGVWKADWFLGFAIVRLRGFSSSMSEPFSVTNDLEL
jgi:hypothetical protein